MKLGENKTKGTLVHERGYGIQKRGLFGGDVLGLNPQAQYNR